MPLTVKEFGEKRIIEEIIGPICRSENVQIGVGDDAAMMSVPSGQSILLSSDKIPEDLLALQLGLMTPFEHGRYLAAVNISDIAAMGGTPAGLLVTLALTNDFEIEYLREFYRGLISICGEYSVDIIGGDLGWGKSICMSATAVGHIPAENVLTRKDAGVGDQVFVTGFVGLWATSLLYFLKARSSGLVLSTEDEEFLRAKLVLPTPRVQEGQKLVEIGLCTSCMDITDGLAQSAIELANYSNVGLHFVEERLPVHPLTRLVAKTLGMNITDLIFGKMGLELELFGTLKPHTETDAIQAIGVSLIGEVNGTGNRSIKLSSGETKRLPTCVGRIIDVIL